MARIEKSLHGINFYNIIKFLLLVVVFFQSNGLLAYEYKNKDVDVFYYFKRTKRQNVFIDELTEYYQTLDESPSIVNRRLIKAISLLDNSCDKLELKIVRLNFLINHNQLRPAVFLLHDLEDCLERSHCSNMTLIYANNAVAETYLKLNKTSKARKHYFLLLKGLKSENNQESIQMAAYIDVGISYQIDNKPDSALMFYTKALWLDNHGEHRYRVNLFVNLANLYLDKKEYETSLFYLKRAQSLKLTDYEKAFIHYYIGNNLELKGDVNGMIKNYKECMYFSKKGKNWEVLFHVYEKLISHYSKEKQFQLAFSYKMQSDSLGDRINVTNASKVIDSLNFENHLKVQKLENTQVKARLSYEAKLKNVLFVIIILAILLFSVIIFFLNKENKKNKLLVLRQIENLPDLSHYHSNEFGKQHEETELVDQNDNLKQNEVVLSQQLITKLDKLLLNKELYKDPNISVQLLAHKLKVSIDTLSKTINTHYKVPFRTLINNKRIELAMVLLLDDDYNHYSIEGIAKTVGYQNMTTFYNNFKLYAGVTPTYFQSQGRKLKLDH